MNLYYDEIEANKEKEASFFNEFMYANENGELDYLLEKIKSTSEKIIDNLNDIAMELNRINNSFGGRLHTGEHINSLKIKCYKLADDTRYGNRRIITYMNHSIQKISSESKETLQNINTLTNTLNRGN